jgi:hypothetical protein
MQLRRNPPSGARHTDRRQRILAATVAVMLVGEQALAALHFAFIPHSIDARTGKVVRCRDATHDHQSGHEPSRCPDDGAPNRDAPSPQECQVYALLQQAQILTSPVSTAQPSTIIETIVPPALDMFVPCRLRVYLVSPAHSPPPSTLV